MGKPTGFMEYGREVWEERPVAERLGDCRELHLPFPEEKLVRQGARCMDCGIPFCHAHGCPLGNLIPDFNDRVYQGKMREALDLLHWTNNFPEFTGRVCPAPCEKACTLSINDAPVTIELIENEIIEYGFARGWVEPLPPLAETGKRVTVIGAGPAGLAAAQQLRRAGHAVTVYEKDERPGGLLAFGIPDFKLDKGVVTRRIAQLEAEGVTFVHGVDAGRDVSVKYLRQHADAIVLACGAKVPRDLPVPGRDLPGAHFAMDFLAQNNRRVHGDVIPAAEEITARGKNVLVIGGGDTGSDCVGTSNRQGAKKVVQIELLPKPAEHAASWNPQWPDWPGILRTSSSHEEGCERLWNIATAELAGNGRVERAVVDVVEWLPPDAPGGRPRMQVKEGSRFTIDADLVLLAMGFVHVEHGPLVTELGVELDERGNVKTGSYGETSVPGIFAAGDTRLGASLVVRAIATGRKAAIACDRHLMGETSLPDTTLM